jgi:hypothetical protein
MKTHVCVPLGFQCSSMKIYVFLWFSLVVQWKFMFFGFSMEMCVFLWFSVVFQWKFMFSCCFSMKTDVFFRFSLICRSKLMFSLGFLLFFNELVCFRFSNGHVFSCGFSMFFNEYVYCHVVFLGFSLKINVFLWFFNVFQ